MPVQDLPRTIWWENDSIYMVDQTRLPLQGDVLVCQTYEGLIMAVKSLAVRGAPALGVAGAYGVALWSQTDGQHCATSAEYLDRLSFVAEQISSARPTAVNLSWGVKRIVDLARSLSSAPPTEIHRAVLAEADNMAAQDEACNRAIGANGAALFDGPTRFLTHCNAGSLATVFYGTALGVIYAAHEQGKVDHVWVDETRPVNQGGRLTIWEMMVVGVPSALICDNMAASVMANGWVDAIVVGADRICANGDTANKIGTYGLAVLARAHNIPFYVAAPSSTFDLSLSDGSLIEIEERDYREVEGVTVTMSVEPTAPGVMAGLDKLTQGGPAELRGTKGSIMQITRKGGAFALDAWFRTTPPNIMVYNPAFDVTPAEYVTAFITEKGVITPGEVGYGDAIGSVLSGR